ncbi:MAG: HpcH/HpaI aldolase/citrate lyase family protein [Thermoplasmatota archaeon]
MNILFTPGTRPDRIMNAIQTGACDVIVADLEDAVAPNEKDSARRMVQDALLTRGEAKRAVRINAWPSKWAAEDLQVLVSEPDYLVVPKVETAADLTELAAIAETPIIAILETAKGVLNASEIAAHEAVHAIALGAEDLAADAGMQRSESNWEMQTHRATVALAAAAHGKVAIDMITADFKDDARFQRECNEARALGYRGKMCIHPAQAALARAAFAPTAEEVAWATRILEAVEATGVGEGGIVVVDGAMVDVPVIRQARRILTASQK